MKTETADVATATNGNAVIWGNTVELPQLFAGEGCLPEIGSSQVSSILSTLDSPESKPALDAPANAALKVPKVTKKKRTRAKSKTVKKPKVVAKDVQIDCKELTYILCELCPFLCLKEKMILQHIELVHKNKKPSEVFELKCPVCKNIFYHKLSLQAHLMYDHCVTNNDDISNIIQIILHSKKTTIYSKELPLEIDIEKTPILIEGATIIEDTFINCKTEIPVLESNNDFVESMEENLSQSSNGSSEDKTPMSKESVKLPLEEKVPEKNAAPSGKPNNVDKSVGDYKFKYFKCTKKGCKVRMQSSELIKYHIDCHANSYYKCKVCNAIFSSWKTLSGHLWRSHKVDMELYRCDHCDFRTACLSRMNNIHKLIHGTTKAYNCTFCEKAFKNSKQLRNHKYTHTKTNTTTYVCSDCEKSFSTKQFLENHMNRIHRKLKPFHCNLCGYKGASRSSLQMHNRQHTGEKPFKCVLCDYSSADHNSLRRHKLRHSGEKPYKCSLCDYETIQTSTYKAHIKTKHPGLDKDLLFSCTVCQFRTINKQLYTQHLSSQHLDLKS